MWWPHCSDTNRSLPGSNYSLSSNQWCQCPHDIAGVLGHQSYQGFRTTLTWPLPFTRAPWLSHVPAVCLTLLVTRGPRLSLDSPFLADTHSKQTPKDTTKAVSKQIAFILEQPRLLVRQISWIRSSPTKNWVSGRYRNKSYTWPLKTKWRTVLRKRRKKAKKMWAGNPALWRGYDLSCVYSQSPLSLQQWQFLHPSLQSSSPRHHHLWLPQKVSAAAGECASLAFCQWFVVPGSPATVFGNWTDTTPQGVPVKDQVINNLVVLCVLWCCVVVLCVP